MKEQPVVIGAHRAPVGMGIGQRWPLVLNEIDQFEIRARQVFFAQPQLAPHALLHAHLTGLQAPDRNVHQLIVDEQNVPHAGIAILSKAAQGRAFDGRVEFAGNELAVDGQVEGIASKQVDFRG